MAILDPINSIIGNAFGTKQNDASEKKNESDAANFVDSSQGNNLQNNLVKAVDSGANTAASQAKSSFSGAFPKLSLPDLQSRAQEYGDKRLSDYKQRKKAELDEEYSQVGLLDYENDPGYQKRLAQIESSSTFDASRAPREKSGNPLKDIVDTNLFGFTAQEKTPDEYLDLYNHMFNEYDANGAPENKVERTWGNEQTTPDWLKNLKVNKIDLSDPTPSGYVEDIGPVIDEWWKKPVVDQYAIDNGESPESRESLWMTGEQYLRYRELGIPGRDLEYIDPGALYNKQREQELYGFVPYLVDDEAIDRYHDDASMTAWNDMYNSFTDLRRNNVGDYELNYEGDTYNGNDFVNRYGVWASTLYDDVPDPFYDKKQVTENSVPLTYVLTTSDGETVYPPTGSPGYEFITHDDGTIEMDFHTGDPGDNWYFDDAEDFQNSLRFDWAGDEHPAYAWQDLKPLELGDGRTIRADKAMELFDNMDDYADYGWFDWKKPVVADPIKEGGWLPWFVDMTLGSAPLFFTPAAYGQALGSAYQNWKGFRAGYQGDRDMGQYRLLSEDPTHEQQILTTAGSLALPKTERIWGNIGHKLLKGKTPRIPFAKTIQERHPGAFEHPLAVWGTGATGEALEEIPGNFVEELQNEGTVGGYFANPLYYYYDDSGEIHYTTEKSDPETGKEYYPAYDEQNRRLKDYDTSFGDRAVNFGKEIPLSMLGGGMLGGAIGIPEAIAARGPYKTRKAEREKFGYNIEIPQEVIDYSRQQVNNG